MENFIQKIQKYYDLIGINPYPNENHFTCLIKNPCYPKFFWDKYHLNNNQGWPSNDVELYRWFAWHK